MNNGVVLKVINKESDGTISKFAVCKYEMQNNGFPPDEFYMLLNSEGNVVAMVSVSESYALPVDGRGLCLNYFCGCTLEFKELLRYVLELKEGWNTFVWTNEQFADAYGAVDEDWLGVGTTKIL